MKKAKRLLSMILTLCLILTMSSVVTPSVGAAPSSNAVVFVKTGGNGNGSTPESPIGSLASAVNTVANNGGGTVVLVGPTELSSNAVLGKGENETIIKITSVNDGVDYRKADNGNAALVFTKSWVNVSSKCVFEYDNIVFRMNGNNCSFYANGYQISFGKDVKTEIMPEISATDPKNYPNVYGGSAFDLSATTNYPANTSATILSGQFNAIVAGGKGSGEKPRPSESATLVLSSDVTVKGSVKWTGDSKAPVEGEKTLILFDGENAALKDVKGEASRTLTAKGNGLVKGIAPGELMLCADKGFGAKINGEFIANGSFKYEGKTLEISFEPSDINKAAELAMSKPTFPAAFPGEYIKGYDNGDGTFSFKPSGNITIAEAATIVVRLITTEEKIKGQNTTDKAKTDDWFYDNVAFIDTYEGFDGFDEFDGNRQITRGEFVKLVSCFKSFSETAKEIKFTDVDNTHKFYDAIRSATMAKIVNGYDNGDGTFSFKPDAPITRAEVVTVINRIFDMADVAAIKYKNMIPNFSDVEDTHWASFQIIAAAGGKEKPVEKTDILGTGEVEHTVQGDAIYVRDGAPEDGDGSSYDKAVTYNKGIGMVAEGGTIVICGPVVFNANFRFTNGHTNTVIMTSVYGGEDFRKTRDAAIIFGSNWRNGVPGGDMIFDNIAFISRGTNNSIYCDNHTVVFGKDVVCAVESGSPIAIYGGSAFDLSATVNYIGSESKNTAHTGEYFSSVSIYGGSWGDVTAGGKGNAEKPRESEGAAIAIYSGAKVGGISGGSKTDNAKVNGLRAVILDNYSSLSIPEEKYDIIVKNTTDKAIVELVSVKKDSVTIKVTALTEGLTVEGVLEDGTLTLTEACGVSVTEKDGKIVVDNGNKDTVDTDNVDGAEYVTDEYLAELDELQAKRKEEIFNTTSEIKPAEGRTAYYVSFSEGNDDNDGLSPEKPWKTITKLNTFTGYKTGDAVYLKRGDEWRGVTLSAKGNVSYSAYGEGEKPIINISPFDGAKHGTWTLVDGYTNVYKYSETFAKDVGSVSFNNRTFIDTYAQKMCYDYKDGKAYSNGTLIEDPIANMKNDLDFWHDCGGPNIEAKTGTGQLYLRSDKGNPAERFNNIEFNPRANGIAITGSGITIDNISVRHAGVHGISSGTTSDLTVTNCVFLWIGGSVQNYNDGKFVRLGNAVEIYGGCDGYTVDNCYIEQVYDAGVTHQVSHTSDGDYIMKNVTYSNNVILRCIYSIEHFNRAKEGTTRYLVNINYKNNLCRLAGHCFGATRPNKGAASHIRSGTIVDTANFVVENNVFDRSIDNLFLLTAGGDEQIQWKNNTYIHKIGGKYGTIKGSSIVYSARIQDDVDARFAFKEVNGKYLYTK